MDVFFVRDDNVTVVLVAVCTVLASPDEFTPQANDAGGRGDGRRFEEQMWSGDCLLDEREAVMKLQTYQISRRRICPRPPAAPAPPVELKVI